MNYICKSDLLFLNSGFRFKSEMYIDNEKNREIKRQKNQRDNQKRLSNKTNKPDRQRRATKSKKQTEKSRQLNRDKPERQPDRQPHEDSEPRETTRFYQPRKKNNPQIATNRGREVRGEK